MRLDPIKIPDIHRHADRANMAAQMAGSTRPGIVGIMLANRRESRFERPAIRGIACRYNVPFEYEGKLTAFAPGCFKDSLRDVALQLEHDEQIVLAENGLRFVDGPDFLAFELELPHNQHGGIIASLVASGSRTDCSVGTRNLQATTRRIRGHDVRLITDGDLVELSLCVDGAVASSHARVVDLENCHLSLEDEARCGVLSTWGGANEIATATKRLAATIDKISQPPAPRVYSVHHAW